MFNNANTKDEVIKKYIEEIFNLYDQDKSGFLNSGNITNFFNDLFRSVDVQLTLTAEQSREAIQAVYPNYTNQISKNELFYVFKALLGMYFWSYTDQTNPNPSLNHNRNLNQIP